jgi:hypothetical protein
MAETDFTVASGSLNSSTVARGVTAGTTPPNGGGSFSFGFRSLTNDAGVVALYANGNVGAGFNPMSKGAEIRGALKKRTGGGMSGGAVFLFVGLQSTSVTALAYMLGLSDDAAPHLILRKGTLVGGLPDQSPGSGGVLARSTDTFAADEWVHLRFEVVQNPSGDVVLNVYRNDLTQNPVTAPVWEAVDGMSGVDGGIAETAFIDDGIGANSGSLPLSGGRAGFGFYTSDSTRIGYVDHIAID